MASYPASSQIRAARGLLDWSQDDLARKADVGICTVRRIESEGTERMRGSVITSILEALKGAGILFIFRGVKLRAEPENVPSHPGEKL